jgi:hypothetical protein
MQWESDEEAERVGPATANEAAVTAGSKQRVKRYRFKTFAQRIAEVNRSSRDALLFFVSSCKSLTDLSSPLFLSD